MREKHIKKKTTNFIQRICKGMTNR